ncbi:STAGA complex 65 subunit gamma-like [Chrysoperla carnea]|uniref:STAGA complex 65 subunit gamma-like n=1 Tax=Chrysoperla carnea TaxID=189513 RepID=UPI001D0679A4|nr:STAGA complex 65 subunit gamma-like [Chrysoperla carnea]
MAETTKRKLWGEIKDPEESCTHNFEDLIDYAKNPNNLKQYLDAVLHPNLRHNKNVTHLIQLPPMETRVLHTISLHHYENQLTDLINKKNNGYRGRHSGESSPPPIPEMPKIPTKCKETRNQFGYLPKASSEFTLGNGVDTPKLSDQVREHLLKQCVGTLFAHVGFENTSESILAILSDVLDEFLKKMCTNLRHAVDNTRLGISEGFPDDIERVFTEMGIGSILGLHEFYTTRVINYQKRVYNRCQNLLKEYEELEKEDVPEFHLSGGEEDHSELLLQPELQMLDYLEQNVEFSLQDALVNPATLQDLEQIFNS